MGDWQLKPGDHVDKYIVVRPLARGGMGEIYEARHRLIHRVVALKCLQIDRQERTDFKDRMQAEAQLLSELNHPNIVKLYDADITRSGMVWMAMELLDGHVLRDIMRKGAIDIPAAVHIACEVADGVGAAHEIRVFHRDLKPENIFVTKNGEVKVLDFGAAKFIDRGLKTTEKWQIVGTPYYMSPEHILAQGVDGRTDLYALGLIFYEMVAGRYPFCPDGQVPDSREVGAFQLYATPESLPSVIEGFPEPMWRVVEKALEKKREDRHATMAEFSRDLSSAKKTYVDYLRNGGKPPMPALVLRPACNWAEHWPAEPVRRQLATERMQPSQRIIVPVSPTKTLMLPDSPVVDRAGSEIPTAPSVARSAFRGQAERLPPQSQPDWLANRGTVRLPSDPPPRRDTPSVRPVDGGFQVRAIPGTAASRLAWWSMTAGAVVLAALALVLLWPRPHRTVDPPTLVAAQLEPTPPAAGSVALAAAAPIPELPVEKEPTPPAAPAVEPAPPPAASTRRASPRPASAPASRPSAPKILPDEPASGL